MAVRTSSWWGEEVGSDGMPTKETQLMWRLLQALTSPLLAIARLVE